MLEIFFCAGSFTSKRTNMADFNFLSEKAFLFFLFQGDFLQIFFNPESGDLFNQF
jgi:hypothetical protein